MSVFSIIGTYFPHAAQPPLSAEERDTVDRFHDLYYRRWMVGADTINLSWLGYKVLKCPLDLWIYQELLVRTRPDVVIETGTAFGGSALFLASVFEHVGHGEVITIDIEPNLSRPQHPRISYLLGSSVDPAIIAEVRARVDGKRAMVVLDSDHHADHVHAEMVAYAPTVQGSDYLIVEDTNINGHPTYVGFGPGPMEAVDRFLAGTGDFEVDERCQRFMMTLNPRGFLRRVAATVG